MSNLSNSASAKQPSLRFMFSHPAHVVSLGFGSGLAPFAPGTFGALFGWWLSRWLYPLAGDAWFFSGLLLVTLVGVLAMHVTGVALEKMDHGAIVWDEVVAMALIVALIPHSFWLQCLGFVLFRIFDIAKPGPVGWADRNVGGAWGVLLDDLIAAALVLVIFALWIKVF